MAFSVSLLAYVGYGEAWRTYPKFELERLAAQGQTVQNALDPFLQAGLPIAEYPGFVPQTRPLLDSDPTVGLIAVVDPRGKILFSNAQVGGGDLANGEFRPSSLQGKASHFQVAESSSSYRVSLELRNKIELVGVLVLYMPRQAVTQEIGGVFVSRVVLGGLALLLLFAIGTTFVERLSGRARRARAASYGVIFLFMAVVVVSALVQIYGSGIRHKTEALANSLSERLTVPLVLGLQLDDFSKIDTVFAEYKKLYPDLSYVALTQGDRIVIDTDNSRVGSTWRPSPGHYEYASPITDAPDLGEGPLAVRAGIPDGVIYDQLWRSAKNFFVLFLASGFLAMIFFDLLNTFTTEPKPNQNPVEVRRTFQENIILPILFFCIFIEALSASFMPQHLQQLARAQGADPSTASTQFAVYYAALALALLPVGRFIESGKMKWVLLLAVVLEIVSLGLMAVVTNVYAMFAIRAVAGAAHGIMATGAQAYLLLLASQGRITHGASRFLFTYNSGIIAGTAIGALLAVYSGISGVFLLATLLVVPVLLFAIRFLPTTLEAGDAMQQTQAQPALLPSLARAVRDPGFASAVLLVGIPSKVVNAGVVAFALPLLLAQQFVPQEDIGQIIMFYPIGILAMSLVVARIVAKLGQPRKALLIGTVAGAAGVAAVGLLVGGLGAGGSVALLLVAGLLILGLAHGLINAPIVTFVATTAAAEQLGRGTVSSAYRFVERAGHMVGPILVSQLLLLSGQNAAAIAWVGIPTLVLGLFFWIASGRPLIPRLKPAAA